MKNLTLGHCLAVLLLVGCASPTSSPSSPSPSSNPADSSAKSLVSFSLSTPSVATGTITGTAIAVTVPAATDVTSLVATFATTGASVKVGSTVQVSGTTPNDFTSPVSYLVTAQDGSTQNYSVTVTVTPPSSSDHSIGTFKFLTPDATGTITGTDIAVTVPSGTVVTSLVATFTTTGASVKVGSTVQVSGTTPNNFTSPVTYTVIAQDGSPQSYTVTVSITAATFSVTYDANGGTGTPPSDSTAYHPGDTVLAASSGSLSNAGTTFAGWTNSLSAPGTSYVSGTSFAMGSANVTLHAIWIPSAFTFSKSGNTITLTSFFTTTSGPVVIPQGVTGISASVGSSSTYVTSVSIPASTATLGVGVFNNCSNLTTFAVAPLNPNWRSDSSGVILSKDAKNLLVAPGKLTGSYVIASTVTAVLDQAFRGCTALTAVTIPNGVTSIGFQSFSNTGLYSVSLPASVTSLGAHAFSAAALQSFTVDSGNPSYSSDTQHALYDKGQTILMAVGVTSIVANTFTIPSTVTTIGSSAFSGYGILHTIIIPSSVTTIGDSAFMFSGLTSLAIPASVTSIGSNAFQYSSNLTNVTMASVTPPTLPTGSQAFSNTNYALKIHVPTNAALTAYSAATGWSSYSSTGTGALVCP